MVASTMLSDAKTTLCVYTQTTKEQGTVMSLALYYFKLSMRRFLKAIP
jgi:hypothetical protein